MKQFKHIILTMIAVMLTATTASAVTAKEIVDKAGQKLRDAASLTAGFTFSGNEITGSGSIILSGNKFKMNVDQVRYWYDGRTLWSYFVSNAEVYVSEPTSDELAEINPVTVLNAITGKCTYKTLKATKGTLKVLCTARDSSVPFASMTITVDSSTYYPKTVHIVRRQGDTVTLTLDRIATGKALASSTFTFKPKDAPGAEIVDMR